MPIFIGEKVKKGDVWYKEGLEEGWKKGWKEGWKEGRQEGQDERAIEIAGRLLEFKDLSSYDIAVACHIPERIVLQMQADLEDLPEDIPSED